MESNRAENSFDPNEILDVPEDASVDVIKGAYRAKERSLLNKKSDGLAGKDFLVPEEDFDKLKEARDELLSQAPDESELPTAELVETKEMEFLRTLNEIKVDENFRGIFSFLVKEEFNSNLPLDTDDVEKFYDLYPTEEGYNDKTNELYDSIINSEDGDRESRRTKWEKYIQSGMRLRSILYKE